MISFRKPMITRGGNDIRLYHIYQNEIHGAYKVEEDRWIIARWELDGHFYPRNETGKQPMTSFDLINNDPEWDIPKFAA